MKAIMTELGVIVVINGNMLIYPTPSKDYVNDSWNIIADDGFNKAVLCGLKSSDEVDAVMKSLYGFLGLPGSRTLKMKGIVK